MLNHAAVAVAFSAVLALASPVAPAQGQTAYDINRLNAAMQICNSPAGAAMAECAQLRARMGMGATPQVNLPGGGLGGLVGGSKAQAAAGILGMLGQARASAAPPAAVAPALNPGAIQQAIATCVQNARGNSAVIQACLQIANAGQGGLAAPAPPRLGIGAYQAQPAVVASPGTANGQAAAMASYQGAQSYQACAAANPTNWQSCMPLLNGGQPR